MHKLKLSRIFRQSLSDYNKDPDAKRVFSPVLVSQR